MGSSAQVSFGSSFLRPFYEAEVYGLCERIDSAVTEVCGYHYPPGSGTEQFRTVLSGFPAILDAVCYAARLAEMLLPGVGTGTHRTPLTTDRARAIESLLSGLTLTAVRDRELRATLDHFAERLDGANERVSAAMPSQQCLVVYNCVVPALTPTDGAGTGLRLYRMPHCPKPVYPIRVYGSNDQTFYNMEASVPLPELQVEARAIIARLKSRNPDLGEWRPALIAFGS